MTAKLDDLLEFDALSLQKRLLEKLIKKIKIPKTSGCLCS